MKWKVWLAEIEYLFKQGKGLFGFAIWVEIMSRVSILLVCFENKSVKSTRNESARKNLINSANYLYFMKEKNWVVRIGLKRKTNKKLNNAKITMQNEWKIPFSCYILMHFNIK